MSDEPPNGNVAIDGYQGMISLQKVDDTTLSIAFEGGLDAQEKILRELIQLNVGVISYRPTSSGLEEAYLRLVKSGV